VPSQQEARTVAIRRLSLRRQRVRTIRRRVIAIALVVFVVAWGLIFERLASGNDPALSASAKAKVTRTQASSTAATSAPQATQSTQTTQPTQSTQPPAVTDSPAPVTTSQS
jgi:cytoskeletal protein RodZ